jgi:uncharacterized small protein (DUF1192 family)
MGLFDDAPVERPVPHRIGEDLATFSIEELEMRIAVLEAEIARLRQATSEKNASRQAAASFFKL